MNLADGKPVEKAIATERAPEANIGRCWGGGRGRCITFRLKNDEKVVELGARSRQGCAADLADQTGAEEIRTRLNTRFTPDAGFNGNGGWARCSAGD